MRLIVCKWFVASSLLFSLATAQTRPQYGGTLRVATSAAFTSLDPADRTQVDSFARNSVTALIFDTLIRLDSSGRPQPSLAISWGGSRDSKRWNLRIRSGLVFHDGSAVTPEAVAASLRLVNQAWNVLAELDSVTIQSDSPVPTMPAMLALPGNAIVKRGSGQSVSGTGPFRVSDWQPGKMLTLAANEDCWRGRPYLDTIEVNLGMPARDEVAAIDTERSTLIQLPGEMAKRMSGHTAVSSPAIELVAIIFARDPQGQDEMTRRDALALSLDRASIHNVLLQGAGDAQGSILPDWMTGYGALFPSQADLPRAKRLMQQVASSPAWTLKYDPADTLLRLLAERIALNAKDAGLVITPVTVGPFDARLVRVVLPVADAWVDLAWISEIAGTPISPATEMSVEQLYAAEQRVLAAKRIIPLLHLPAVYAATKSLRGWSAGATGTWQIADAWQEPSVP